MRNTIIAISTLCILTSCCSDSDFAFTEKHRNLLNKYTVNDTIYFLSSKSDLDTILITKIDSLQECGILMAGKRKSISVEIKHLPINKWTGGTEMYQDKPSKVLNQELITIEKLFDKKIEEQYYIGISFRDFQGELKNISETETGISLADLGINKYWEINNEIPDDKLDSASIAKILWTEKYGLTGYYKRNGDFYKIKRD